MSESTGQNTTLPMRHGKVLQVVRDRWSGPVLLKIRILTVVLFCLCATVYTIRAIHGRYPSNFDHLALAVMYWLITILWTISLIGTFKQSRKQV